jgi:hypothetical protein
VPLANYDAVFDERLDLLLKLRNFCRQRAAAISAAVTKASR